MTLSKRVQLIIVLFSLILAFSVSEVSASSFNLSADRTMRMGMSGDDVLELQQILWELGYYVSTPDGEFDQETKDALIDFQKTNGQAYPDGEAGLWTIGMLNSNPKKKQSALTRKLIFIGDSRTYGMYEYVYGIQCEDYFSISEDGSVWSKKPKEGYEWMTETGVPQIEEYIDDNTDIIIYLGINDIGSEIYTAEKYCSYINNKAALWKKSGANIYYVSVTPVGYFPGINHYAHLSNYGNIAEWNDYMQNNLSEDVSYIDAYNRIISNYRTVDGIHYNESCSLVIYDFIIENR